VKKKILFLLHLPPPIHGSSMVGQYIKESKLINERYSCDYLNLLASRNVSETGKLNFKKIKVFISLWFKLLFKIVRTKPDLCYVAITASGVAFFRDVLLIVLLKLFGVKRIYHMHNKGVNNYKDNKIYNFCYTMIFKDAEVILLSKYLYPDVKKYVPETKIHICPNGIPHVESSNDKKRGDKTVKILFLSNLIESKGVYVLLQACEKLAEKGIDFRCDFIGGEGDITHSDINKRIIKNGLQDRVKYLGKKFNEAKNQAFEKADIFAFPTFYPNECFPLVLLEAEQFCLPIISTFEGGIPDIIEEGKTGFLVPQMNVYALAEKLEKLIRNPELARKIGKAGKIKFEKEFTLEKFEKRMCEILNNKIEK
jgi:glycosyltransferase involved in cell wall biosynthesis